MEKFEVAIIGGGLAGLISAIHLAQNGFSVILFEKNNYPVHKVCGEYLSQEVLPYLNALGIDLIKDTNPQFINKLHFSSISGKSLETNLPLGGLGISRFCLDAYFYQKASENGVKIRISSVQEWEFVTNSFIIKTSLKEIFEAEILIGTYGKRSNLDKKLQRKFIQKKSPWLAVKTHFENSGFPEEVVGLHSFPGGYCGLSKTETNAVNFCYLTSYKSFQAYKNTEKFKQEILSKNPYLKEFLSNAKPIFENPLTIAQISFEKKKIIENHILLCGDAAGLIHPLCGNGMAMAIHGAKIVSDLVSEYFKSGLRNRINLEKKYVQEWNQAFRERLFFGNKLQSLLLMPKLSDFLISSILKNEALIQKIIKRTHGNPF